MHMFISLSKIFYFYFNYFTYLTFGENLVNLSILVKFDVQEAYFSFRVCIQPKPQEVKTTMKHTHCDAHP